MIAQVTGVSAGYLYKLFSKNGKYSLNYLSKRCVGAYDSDGKTVAKIINKKNQKAETFLVHSFHNNGFSLTNGVMIFGPCILFPNYVLGWNVNGDHEINEKSLEFFFYLKPKLDMLLIGVGEKEMVKKVSKEALFLSVKYKINIETQIVDIACGTYNFMVEDRMNVAGAFVPPLKLAIGAEDVMFSKNKYKIPETGHMPGGEPWF